MIGEASISRRSVSVVHTNHGRIQLRSWPAHFDGCNDWPALWSATARFLFSDQTVPTFGVGTTWKEALAACCRALDYYKRREKGLL